MKEFNWKLANVTLTKTFVTSFFTPLLGAQVVFNESFMSSVYVGVITSAIMCGIVFGQILDRYKKFLEENSNV